MSVLLRKGAYGIANVQTLNSGATSNVTYAFSNVSSIIRIATNQDIFFAMGDSYYNPNPVAYATGNCAMIPAGGVEFIACNAFAQVAVIQVSTGGNVSVAELKSTIF